MSGRLRLALVQTASGDDPEANRARLGQALDNLASPPDVALLPEYAFCRGTATAVRAAARAEADWAEWLTPLARSCRAALVAGGVPLSERGQLFDSALAVAPDGRCLARYDKIHLFRMDGGDAVYDEGTLFSAGTTPVAFELDGWRLALSICFDLRFPELYRALAPCDVILCPAAFTTPTGEAHWHTLLRARAIEIQCYVAAAAQHGPSPAGDVIHYGHTLCADPWGQILSETTAEADTVLTVSLDHARLCEVRKRLPALACRRLDALHRPTPDAHAPPPPHEPAPERRQPAT